MTRNTKLSLWILSLLLVVGLLGGLGIRSRARAQSPERNGTAPQAALGTAFTYQGRLLDGGTPANGTYDFEFRLYDAASGGTQVGPTLTQTGVSVNDGRFTVQLDFGNVFTSSALWLQIAVRPSGGGSYTSLGRQALTAAPFAAFAQKAPWSGLTGVPAGFADNADDDTLAALSCTGGQVPKWNGSAWTCAADSDTTYAAGTGLFLSGNQFALDLTYLDGRYYPQSALQTSGQAQVHWGNLTNVPAGFADNADDDTLAGLSCASGQVAKWNGSAWSCAADDDTTYSAGDGLALAGTQFRVTFSGTGTATTVARSDHNHDDAYQARLVRTVIVSPVGNGSDPFLNGAALLDAVAQLSATNSFTYLVKIEPGVYDLGPQALRLGPYVDLEGSGRDRTLIRGMGHPISTTGVLVITSVNGIRNLTVESYGGDSFAVGIYGSSPMAFLSLQNVQVLASGGFTMTAGIVFENGAVLEGRDLVVYVQDQGPFSNYALLGLELTNGAQGRLFDSEIYVDIWGFTLLGIGTDLLGSFLEVRDSIISARLISGTATAFGIQERSYSSLILWNSRVGHEFFTSIGLHVEPNSTAQVNHSALQGLVYSLDNNGGSAQIGASLLAGPITNVIGVGGTLNCVFTYDGTYAPVACP